MEREQIAIELQKNADQIINKLLPKALEEGQENKYKNYINALDATLRLIEQYRWTLKWSKFRDENGTQFISIWEQDINKQIRNNEKFAVDESCGKFNESVKDIIIKRLLDLDFYNNKDEFIFRIPYIEDVCLYDNLEFSELSGLCKFPIFDFNDDKCIYKVKSKIELINAIDNSIVMTGDITLPNTQILSSESKNSKISLKLLKVDDDPPYIINVSLN